MCSRYGDDSNPSLPECYAKKSTPAQRRLVQFFLCFSRKCRNILNIRAPYCDGNSFTLQLINHFFHSRAFSRRRSALQTEHKKQKQKNSPSSQPKTSRRKQAPPADQDCSFTRRLRVMIGPASRCVIGLTESWLPRKC